MNIKSLLLGSAAALVAVSGANAADAIVVAEPEPMEYVKVCDAAGDGYFYIPGGETCLKISGSVSYTIGTSDSSDFYDSSDITLKFSTWTDTEYGALTAFITLDGDADSSDTYADNEGYAVMDAYGFGLGGFAFAYDSEKFSSFGGILADDIFDGGPSYTSVSYTYDFGAGSIWASVEAPGLLDETDTTQGAGLSAGFDYGVGDFAFMIDGGYDLYTDEGAVFASITGPVMDSLSFALIGAYQSGYNMYGSSDTDYAGEKFGVEFDLTYVFSDDVSATVGYEYIEGVYDWGFGASVNWTIVDGFNANLSGTVYDDDSYSVELGFVRSF